MFYLREHSNSGVWCIWMSILLMSCLNCVDWRLWISIKDTRSWMDLSFFSNLFIFVSCWLWNRFCLHFLAAQDVFHMYRIFSRSLSLSCQWHNKRNMTKLSHCNGLWTWWRSIWLFPLLSRALLWEYAYNISCAFAHFLICQSIVGKTLFIERLCGIILFCHYPY